MNPNAPISDIIWSNINKKWLNHNPLKQMRALLDKLQQGFSYTEDELSKKQVLIQDYLLDVWT